MHDISGSGDRRRGALGIEPETGADRLEDGRRRAVADSARAGPAGSSDLALFARDGRQVSIAAAQLAQGGFIVQVMPQPGEFALPAGLRLGLEAGGKTISAIVPETDRTICGSQDLAKAGAGRRSACPLALAAEPVAWGGGVLIPGRDSRAYLIDPLTAPLDAEPFVPKFDRDHQGNWLTPAVIDRERSCWPMTSAGLPGRAQDDARPAPGRGSPDEARQRIIADPVSTGGAVIVVTADGRVRALAVRDLSPVGSWALEAPAGRLADRRRRRLFRHGPSRRRHGLRPRRQADLVDQAGGGGRRARRSVQDQSVWLLTRGRQAACPSPGPTARENRRRSGHLARRRIAQRAIDDLVAAGTGTIRPLPCRPRPSTNRP